MAFFLFEKKKNKKKNNRNRLCTNPFIFNLTDKKNPLWRQ